MKKMMITGLLMVPLLGWSQTDLIFPWITNNPSFRGQIVINNLNNETVSVTLTATRPTGNEPATETTDPIEIEALGQLSDTAANLFPNLGEGSAYMVRVTSTSGNITGAFINAGAESPSGNSPSQANVFDRGEGANILLFNFFTISADGFSAPVVINAGDVDTTVTFHAFQNGLEAGKTTRPIAALTPFAELASTLFPDLEGNIFVVVEADQPLLGVAFIFNISREPSMANAVPIPEVPGPIDIPVVSFAQQIQPIFSQSCGNGLCHLDGSASGGLQLDASAYNNIVQVMVNAPGFTDLAYIQPGDPDNSYLYRKLQSPADANYFGQRMPRGRGALDQASLDLIRNWILQGAPDN